jgi:hypothetical protein
MSRTSVSFKFTLALIALCSITACGGGGGDAPAAAAPASAGSTSTAAPYTKDDAEAFAGIGFIISELITLQARLEQPVLAYFAQSFLSDNTLSGSTGPATVSCASSAGGSGTLSVTVIKSGTYAGLKTNDKIDVTFNNCNFGGGSDSRSFQNGRLAITAKADYANLGAVGSGFKFNYQLSSIRYSINIGARGFISNGVQDVQFDSTASASYPKLDSSVINAYTYEAMNPTAETTATLDYSLRTGAKLSSQLTSAGANYSSTIDGPVGLTVTSNSIPESIALAYTTPAPMTGAVVSGRLIPSAGVLRVKETNVNLQTESTVQGSIVQVKADTDRDGILDLTFSTTYSALTNGT